MDQSPNPRKTTYWRSFMGKDTPVFNGAEIISKKYDLPVEDKLHTVGNHLCIQIKRVIKEIESPILITGGGSFNSFWIKNLSNLGLNIKIPDRELVEYKEALIFALLGVLKKENLINVLSSVTGSSSDTSSGDMFNPNS